MVKRKKTKQKKGQNRSTQGLGNLGRFVQFLTYKAKLVGKSVIRITKNTQLRNVVIMGKSMICLLGSVL
jgi:putative transposase